MSQESLRQSSNYLKGVQEAFKVNERIDMLADATDHDRRVLLRESINVGLQNADYFFAQAGVVLHPLAEAQAEEAA